MPSNFADWYTGNMAPPLALPGGGYVPAPLSTPQMSVQDMYQGIYEPAPLPSQGLTTRPVQTYRVTADNWDNPMRQFGVSGGATPMLGASADVAARGRVPIPVNGGANSALGAIANATGSMYAAAPNQPAGSINAFKAQDRLPALPEGLPLGSGMQASARGGLGAGVGSGGTLTASLAGSPVHKLNTEPTADEGQFYADNLGMPVRTPSGKVYQPTGGPQTPKQRMAAKEQGQQQTRRPGLLDVLMGNAEPRQGGLLSLFMGGDTGRGKLGSLGALLGGMGGGMPSGPSAFGSSPSQGLAMTVNPGTSTGQTLSSMGFSDGAAVPAATIRNLSERGYI